MRTAVAFEVLGLTPIHGVRAGGWGVGSRV